MPNEEVSGPAWPSSASGWAAVGILLVDASRLDIVPENLNPAVIWLINDADARLSGGMDAPIGEGSIVTIMPSIHGG
jgi:molybdopterin converting factor small subunit